MPCLHGVSTDIFEPRLAVFGDHLDRALVLRPSSECVHAFLQQVRISVEILLAGSFGGAAGRRHVAFSWFMKPATRHSTKATMRASDGQGKEVAPGQHRPLFFASARLVAVTDFDSPVKIIREVEAAGVEPMIA